MHHHIDYIVHFRIDNCFSLSWLVFVAWLGCEHLYCLVYRFCVRKGIALDKNYSFDSLLVLINFCHLKVFLITTPKLIQLYFIYHVYFNKLEVTKINT